MQNGVARLAVVIAIAAALIAPTAASAAPGLVVRGIAGPSVGVWRGDRVAIGDTTANTGPTAAPRAVTAYWLSRRGTKVLLGRRYLPSLAPGASSRGRRIVVFRLRVKPGVYRLSACVSPRTGPGRTRCLSARQRVTVLDPKPNSVSSPGVSGTPLDGQTLTASTGRWVARGPLYYGMQWQRCATTCTDVPAATGLTYKLTPDDVGMSMRVMVSASAPAGSRAKASPATSPVAALPPVSTAQPVISGVALSGLTVSSDSGAWSGTPPFAFSYQWQHCDPSGTTCTDIPGATDANRAVVDADAPMLRVAVTASGRGGSATAYSAPVPAGPWSNPVYDAAPVPDPFVLDNNSAHDDYWEFNTGGRFPILHSTDLVHWQAMGTALDARPAWVVTSGDPHPWAPSILQTSAPCPGQASGHCYLMYYVGLSDQYFVNCVAVATSPTPGGPYTDRGPLADPTADPTSEPVGCGDSQGQGNIDPSPFVDQNGSADLYVSTDSPQPTVSVIPLTTDRLGAAGARTPLFSGDAGTWEAAAVGVPTVEGPFALLHNGTYYVFYSGGGWQTHYGMGYATGSSPIGPFTKSAANPILSETAAVASPGGGDLPVTGPRGGEWLAYHGRDTLESNPRTLRLDAFSWRQVAGAPDVPVIAGPTATPQPALP